MKGSSKSRIRFIGGPTPWIAETHHWLMGWDSPTKYTFMDYKKALLVLKTMGYDITHLIQEPTI